MPMAKLCFVLMAVPLTAISISALTINDVWINEIHYDNAGADTGEFVEIAGIAGIDLTGLTIELYNGFNGTVYDTINLGGTLADTSDGYGFLSFAATDMQNGPPDGISLKVGTDIQFLSYEGTFTAVGGEANGMLSTDIGVSEHPAPPAGFSLQFLGHADIGSWTGPITSTSGTINTGQILPKLTSNTSSDLDPVPDTGTSLGFLGLGLTALIMFKRKHT